MRKNSAFFSSKTHIRSQIRAFRLFEISFQPEYSFFLSFAQSKFTFFRHKKFLFFYFRQLRTHSANTKTQKHKNIKKFLKGCEPRRAMALPRKGMNPFPLVTGAKDKKTISKIFPSHGLRLFTDSQTALAECRRAWDLLLKNSTTETHGRGREHETPEKNPNS